MPFTFTYDGKTYSYASEVGNNETARVLLVEAQQPAPELSLDESGDE